MQFGVCKLSIVPVRISSSDKSEMVTQLLYGDIISIIEENDNWTKIKSVFDNYVGWIDSKQYEKINEIQKTSFEDQSFSNDLVEFVENKNKELLTITIGSVVSNSKILNHKYEGKYFTGRQNKESIIKTALLYLHSPYLWGGKTPFGIDCSGLSQMVYKINGYKIPRDAKDQVNLGVNLGFIEESKEGDLAFFDNDEGEITHVGILLKNNYIIHASGQVKIDKIDQTGIYDLKKKKHTHKLRTIKNIIDSN